MTTYLLKRHQRRRVQASLFPDVKAEGSEIRILVCKAHQVRVGLASLSCVGPGGREPTHRFPTRIEMKLKHSTLDLLHITKHENENYSSTHIKLKGSLGCSKIPQAQNPVSKAQSTTLNPQRNYLVVHNTKIFFLKKKHFTVSKIFQSFIFI